MSKGPEQIRYEQAIADSSSASVMAAAVQWRSNANMLGQVAHRLRAKAGDAHGISKQTGPAMANAFTKSAEAMDEKSKKMTEGADALEQASSKLKAAEDAQSEMRPLNDPGTYTGPSQPKTKDEVAAKGQYDTALSTYQQDKEHNERIARQHNTAMDSQNETSTAVMKSIHGQPDPEPQPTAAGGATGTRTMSGSGSHHGTSYTSNGGHISGGSPTPTWQPHHGTTTTTTGGGGHHHHGGNPGTGTPAGSTVATTDTPTLTSPLTSTGGPGPSAGASVGGVGAALGAGALGGAGTALGGIRGGSIPAEGSVTSSGGRSIGSTTRSSSSGTLGRSSLARAGALSEAEEEAGARSGASRSGAAGSASRTGTGAGSRAGAAGQGSRSGGRGGGGSAGGGSRKNKKDGSSDHDHLLIDEDWIDDEGEAPPVLA